MRTCTRRPLLAAFVAFSLPLFAACQGGGSDGPPGPTLKITGFGWAEESIDPTFWTSPPPNQQTAFYDFWIHYDGDIAFGDIQSARVYTPDGHYWNLAPTADLLDTTNKVIGGWYRHYASAGNLLPIGALRAEVKLTDGVVSTYVLYVPAPASSTSGSYTTMYSEDAVAPPPTSAPMIRRATAGTPNTFTAATQTVTLTFAVADPKVHDGWVWFYDASGAGVATSPYFVDPATRAASPLLAGGTFQTDGTPNTLSLSAADVRLVAGKTFAQIARYRVVLTDGAQYGSTTYLRYDCRSISAVTPLTLQ